MNTGSVRGPAGTQRRPQLVRGIVPAQPCKGTTALQLKRHNCCRLQRLPPSPSTSANGPAHSPDTSTPSPSGAHDGAPHGPESPSSGTQHSPLPAATSEAQPTSSAGAASSSPRSSSDEQPSQHSSPDAPASPAQAQAAASVPAHVSSPGPEPNTPPASSSVAAAPKAAAAPAQPTPGSAEPCSTSSPASSSSHPSQPDTSTATPAPPPATAAAAASKTDDDDFAKAWRPPPGEPPLWWVDKFEARRRQEAALKAEDPTFVTTQERVAAGGGDVRRNPALAFLWGVLQVVQLFAVLGALLLLPAAMHDGGLGLARVWCVFAAYLGFFGLGSVARMVRHGPLSARSKDKQVSSWAGRLAFAVFVLTVPLLHMVAMYRYVGLSLYTKLIPSTTTLYDMMGAVGTVLAIVLNVLASLELGPAYDRIAAPSALCTSGPYKFVQHPIYTSYMLLFVSYSFLLHSAPAGLLMLLVCGLYYRARTALEARVLREKFGSYYESYASRTKLFVPFVL